MEKEGGMLALYIQL
jgi:hypothetical protein